MIKSTVQLDPNDRFFEQENNIGFFTANLDPQPNTAGAIRRRVTAMFGDAEPEGDYHEPQNMTDDTLMDVRTRLSSLCSDEFRLTCLERSSRYVGQTGVHPPISGLYLESGEFSNKSLDRIHQFKQ
jgi:hypothetical protein